MVEGESGVCSGVRCGGSGEGGILHGEGRESRRRQGGESSRQDAPSMAQRSASCYETTFVSRLTQGVYRNRTAGRIYAKTGALSKKCYTLSLCYGILFMGRFQFIIIIKKSA